MEEPNASALFETLYAKEVLVVKGKDERKKKLQQVRISIIYEEIELFFQDFIECLIVIEQYICRFQSFKQKLFPPDLNEQEKVRSILSFVFENLDLFFIGRIDSICHRIR